MESVRDSEGDQLSSTGDSEEDESSSVGTKTDGELIERVQRYYFQAPSFQVVIGLFKLQEKLFVLMFLCS